MIAKKLFMEIKNRKCAIFPMLYNRRNYLPDDNWTCWRSIEFVEFLSFSFVFCSLFWFRQVLFVFFRLVSCTYQLPNVCFLIESQWFQLHQSNKLVNAFCILFLN